MLKKLARIFHMPLPMRISLLTRVTLLALNFLTALVVARLYGAEATGQIGLIAAILAVTSVVSLGGFQMMALRHFAGDPPDLKTLFTAYLLRVVIGALIVGLLLQLVVVPLFGALFEDSLGDRMVWLLSFIAAANTLRIFLYETLRSQEEIITYRLLLLVGPINLLLLILVVPVVIPGLNLAWLVVISELVGLVVVVPLLRQKGRGIGLTAIRMRDLKVRSRQYYVSSLSIMANTQDILLIGMIVSVEQLGVYVIASRFAGVVALPKTMAGISFAPEVARTNRDQGREAALMFTRRTTRTFVPLTIVLSAFMIACGPLVLDFLGLAFREGYPILVLLVCAHLLLALTGLSGSMLMMIGHQRMQQFIFIASTVVMMGLLVLLLPRYGILGGGISVLAGAIVLALFGTIAIQRLMGTGITAFHVYCGNDPARDSSNKS
jgi:O-antigen/teichoic acid export membrane protein